MKKVNWKHYLNDVEDSYLNTFVNLHRHDDYSNGNTVEIVTKYTDYIEQDKINGVKAFCITNSGNVGGWVKRKEISEKYGMKYIHGIEMFVTESLEDKIKDNYQLILLAKNWEGVKEINILSSRSFNGRGLDDEDYHFHYVPRISREEVFNTSDNIIILTGGLNSPLWQNYIRNFDHEYTLWKNFIISNSHRVFLEVQPHNINEQKLYNQHLLKISSDYGLKIVATNDVHSLNPDHEITRNLLKLAKSDFLKAEENEDLELWDKNTNEIVQSFRDQNVLTEEDIQEAVNNTNIIADSIEDFELDRSIRYPKLYNNPTEVFQEAIKVGIKRRNIDKKPKDEQKMYFERVNKEYKVYQKLQSTDFMLMQWHVSQWIRDHNMYAGPGRGSAAGSLISYLLDITDLDPIEHDLSFERFMNESRISLADIDSDMYSEDRWEVQKYLLTHDKLHCASIMTIGTYGTKGAIRDLGKALGYTPLDIALISKSLIEEDGQVIIPNQIYADHKELFDYAKKIDGVINNFGRHAAGVLVYSEPLEDIVGTMRVNKFDYPVTQLNMKEIDGLNLVKLDLLGLDNVGLMNLTEKLAELPHLTPQSRDIIDFNDKNVIQSIAEDNTAIFQFEKKRSAKLLKDMFRDSTLKKIQENNPDVTYVELLSLLTAALRPSGESYLEDVINGNFTDNGHAELNAFLRKTQGNLVYQEQQTAFLVNFCGWSEAHGDLIRRGIGKKSYEIMNKEVPKIKPTFVKTMVEKYNDTKEHAEEVADRFVQIFMDSVNYGFNKSHAYAYSYISYISAWLRYYYPLEFCTAALQIWKDNQDKTNSLIKYAKSQNININPPTFRYSKGDYFFDKEKNAIYQGTSHIKGNNATTGDILYSLRNKKFDFFIDLLLQIRDESTILITVDEDKKKRSLIEIFNLSEDEVKALDKDISKDKKLQAGKYEITQNSYPINKTKFLSLIRLGFFDEFGSSKKLERIFTEFQKVYTPSNKTFKGKRDKYHSLLAFEKELPNSEYSIFEKCEFELFYTGQVSVINKDIPPKYAFVTGIETIGKTRTSAIVYSINKGIEISIKVGSKIYKSIPFKEGDLIEIEETKSKPKNTKVDGVWKKHPTEKELWVESLTVIRKGNFKS